MGVFMLFSVASPWDDSFKSAFLFLFKVYGPFVLAKNFFYFLYPVTFWDTVTSVIGV